MLLGILVAMCLTNPKIPLILLYLLGVGPFLMTKWSIRKELTWKSFGTSGMSKKMKISYFAGYLIMLVAVGLNIYAIS